MLTIITPAHEEWVTEQELAFYLKEDPNSWMGFPCDSEGNVTADGSEPWYENYQSCLKEVGTPDSRYEKPVVKTTKYYNKVPALVKCPCGGEFYLEARYMGACECPECGAVYNVFGQRLTGYTGCEDY